MLRYKKEKELIQQYIEDNILPQYDNFDKGHGKNHVRTVISDSISISSNYDVDADMVYVIAAYHDLGLMDGRDLHEKRSGELLLADGNLKSWFSSDELTIMQEAVEDHRASNSYEPRSMYGKIVAEADRDISYETILSRTIQYSLKQYPEYTYEQHCERSYYHMVDKYGTGGYLKLWLNTEKNTNGLIEIRTALENKKRFMEEASNLITILVNEN